MDNFAWKLPLFAMLLAGCAHVPESYPAPRQQEAISGPEIASYGDSFRATAKDSDNYVVADISAHDSGTWRWTAAKPELRFFLTTAEKRTLRVQFVIRPMTFKSTGPVTVVFRVNGNELGRERYESAGRKVYAKAVQPDWFFPNGENRVVLEVLNVWQAEPEVMLGVLLEAAGLQQE